MTNLEVLKDEMSMSGYKMGAFADRLGLSRGGLYKKLEGESAFTIEEALKLTEMLGLTEQQRNAIFFTHNE